jgi:hypothetical protein
MAQFSEEDRSILSLPIGRSNWRCAPPVRQPKALDPCGSRTDACG